MTILDPGYALQNIISQGTSEGLSTDGVVGPHHPITCHSDLQWHPDGAMTCSHSKAESSCCRNQYCLNASIAILIIELAVNKFGG